MCHIFAVAAAHSSRQSRERDFDSIAAEEHNVAENVREIMDVARMLD